MSPNQSRYAQIVVAVLLFGVLMGFRGSVTSLWGRAAVAGLAGGCLGFALVRAKRGPPKPPDV